MSNPTQGLNSGPTLSSYFKELRTNTRPKRVHYGDQVLSSQVVPASFMAPHSVTYDSLFLPRPEFSKFAGDPLEFQLFISDFETHIEPRVQCERSLFCLLLQHCSNQVKDLISHFSVYKQNCYTLAKLRLSKEYCSPWIIADASEQKLKRFPVIKSGDGQQLNRIEELLEKTSVHVIGFRQYTSLDSLDTLTDLAGKLPYDLIKSWVRETVKIENSTRFLANFSHFVDFVRRQADELTSLFGQRSLCSKTSASLHKTEASSFGVVASKPASGQQSTLTRSAGSCWFCKDSSHKLLNCKKFQNVSVNERNSFVKTNKLCFKCLSSRHRTPQCKAVNTCSIQGCTGTFHHTLLHRHDVQGSGKPSSNDVGTSISESSERPKITCAFTDTKDGSSSHSQVFLCIVPVKVSHGGKEITTYAFLDQGSTHSFCSESLLKELNHRLLSG